MDILGGLNKNQKEAVMTTEGPVMVMAGAGSGKTKVLTTRIAHLIADLGIPSSQILAVTFTNKASKEMKDRIQKMLNIETKFMWVSTFHSFCSRLLRLEITALQPYTKSFIIIDDEDSIKIVKDIMKELDIDDYKPKEIRNLISKSKNFIDFSISDPALNNCYMLVNSRYNTHLKENNLLDFDDLIIKTIELFKKNPDILQKYQNKFQYILVDEFQDTNTLQYNLIFMLASRYHNLFVVGDDFQSIYSFRGAKIENINRFRQDFLEHKLILLEENYRSTSQILALANEVIKNNPNQIKKVMFSNQNEGDNPVYFHANTSYEEVMFVIDQIKELVLKGDSYNDIAILYRANYISRNFEDMLVRYQIPYKIYGGLSFFARKEIKDAIAYLRVIVNQDDDFSFQRIINEPKRKIGPSLINKLRILANDNKISLFKAIDQNVGSGIGVEALKTFKTKILHLNSLVNNMSLPKLLDLILDETGYIESLKKDEDSYEDRIDNLKELKSVLKEAEDFYEGDNLAKLEQLLADLSLRTDSDDDIDNDNCVRLSTYHQVKGLEFKDVFMVAMEEGIFPSASCIKDSEIEEERRICYVGITRAKKRLYLSNAENRFLFGSQSYMLPSRFINEMAEILLPKKKEKRIVAFKEKKEIVNLKDDVILNVGDKINHKVFGDGLIVSKDNNVITVAFKVPYGIKKLMANHPAIRKL